MVSIMKLIEQNKGYLEKLLTKTINEIENNLIQNGIENKDTLKKYIEQGNIELEELCNELNAYKEILKKLDNFCVPGASRKQIAALTKTAAIKKNTTSLKIENALNILTLQNMRISIYSVAKTANISYNTAKRFKKVIEQRESYRLSQLARGNDI